jgi:small-conductance mechanosensitive channel
LTLGFWQALRTHGIDIPCPQRVVHLPMTAQPQPADNAGHID